MRILLLSLGLVLTSLNSAVAQESPNWRTANGELVLRQCLPRDAYGETTPLPSGCPALLDGGGILYTRLADSQTSTDIYRLRSQIHKHKSALVSLQTLLKDTTGRHSAIVTDLSAQCDRCAEALENAPNRASIWIAIGAGFAAGAAVMATIFVVN